jgi:hypothetical protein
MKNLIKKIGEFLNRLLSTLAGLALEYADEAVLVTEEIKNFVEQNGEHLDAAVLATKTKKDDKILALVKDKLPGVVRVISETEFILRGSETDEEVLAKFYDRLRLTPKDGRVKFYVDLAARLLIAVVGKKLPYWLAVLITQKAFGKIFKNAY